MSTLALAEGAIFANRYRVGRCIAMGGMGAVYEVVHLETERRRALKVMLPHLVESQELRERFRREARVAAQIESEFIVDAFDAGIDEATGMPFLVMELLRGEELGKRLTRVGRFPPGEVLAHLWQTALALDKTHGANIVHRDLKPENLFLCEREDGPPRIKVLDFGIAKLIAEGGTHANATRSLGTPLYMAPEQFLTDSSVSPASDIYSLGMIAYTLLVGVPYWKEEKRSYKNVFAFSAVVMLGPQEPATVRASRWEVTLPPAFDSWFRRATATAPDARFGTATAAVQALAEVLAMPPQVGRPAQPLQERAVMPASEPGQTVVLGAANSTNSRSSGDLPRGAGRIRSVAIAAALFVVLGIAGAWLFQATRAEVARREPAAVAPAAVEVAPAPREPPPLVPLANAAREPLAASPQEVPAPQAAATEVAPPRPAGKKAAASKPLATPRVAGAAYTRVPANSLYERD